MFSVVVFVPSPSCWDISAANGSWTVAQGGGGPAVVCGFSLTRVDMRPARGLSFPLTFVVFFFFCYLGGVAVHWVHLTNLLPHLPGPAESSQSNPPAACPPAPHLTSAQRCLSHASYRMGPHRAKATERISLGEMWQRVTLKDARGSCTWHRGNRLLGHTVDRYTTVVSFCKSQASWVHRVHQAL